MGIEMVKNRKYKDTVFLVLFLCFWVAIIINASYGFSKGNPLRLQYGIDYKGNICGDANLSELKLKYYLNPNQVFLSDLTESAFKLENARIICLRDCPNPSEGNLKWVCDYPEAEIKINIREWIHRGYHGN